VNHRNLLSHLQYRGLVRRTRRNYHVFEGPQVFVVLSQAQAARGNYHVIERQALNYVLSRVGGNRSITPRKCVTRAGALNSSGPLCCAHALYALAGIKKARIPA